MPDRSTMRVLDASANRAREAVRVLEDAVRFLTDDCKATETLKTFRHDLAAAANRIPLHERLDSRDTVSDVGTQIAASDEYERASIEKIITANFCRLQESLRSLEEFSKLAFPEWAPEFEQLRYRSYTLQKTLCGLCAGVRAGAAPNRGPGSDGVGEKS